MKNIVFYFLYSLWLLQIAFSQIINSESMTFKNVKTDTVNVNGTKFYYRKLGENNEGVPVIFLNHLGATLDNCDPRIMDGIATKHQIIAFDNRGVGATEGKTPITIAEMAKDAMSFIQALGYEKVDIGWFFNGWFYFTRNIIARTTTCSQS